MESTNDGVSRRVELRRGVPAPDKPQRIDLAEAWKIAQAKIREASGLDVVKESKKQRDPVSRARKLAEIASPMDMRLSLILGLGCTPDELERDKSGVRLMLESAHKRLSIVGLRSGEVQEHDVSDRFAQFMARFADARAKRALSPGGVDDDHGRILDVPEL